MCRLVLAMAVVVLCVPAASAELRAGAAQVDITPPAGTPSAGYGARMGKGMEGVHDPLLATAVVIDDGEQCVALVGVDHLGMGRAMVEEVREQLKANSATANCTLFLGSSHTHAGGGAFLDIPVIGERLAGKYDPAIYQSYIDGAAKAVIEAASNMKPAKVGVGYGDIEGLNGYRGDWPPNVETQTELALIKVTTADDAPLAALFNYAAHSTVLGSDNMQFSADFIGPARQQVRALLGESVQPVFFNGAQGDVSPRAPEAADDWGRIEAMGRVLAEEVARIWEATEAKPELKIEVATQTYQVLPDDQPNTMPIPLGRQESELGLIVLNDVNAFVAIPGELSTIYDADIKRFGGWLGYEHVSILGLTNDAHGYIITPESWRHRTYESTLSFGGELYGDRVESMVNAMLHKFEPDGAYQADEVQESTAIELLDGKAEAVAAE